MRDMVEIEIPPDLLAQFDALPDRQTGSPKKAWQPWEDKLLLAYWPIKTQSQVCKLLGVSENTARARFRELKEATHETDRGHYTRGAPPARRRADGPARPDNGTVG